MKRYLKESARGNCCEPSSVGEGAGRKGGGVRGGVGGRTRPIGMVEEVGVVVAGKVKITQSVAHMVWQ